MLLAARNTLTEPNNDATRAAVSGASVITRMGLGDVPYDPRLPSIAADGEMEPTSMMRAVMPATTDTWACA